MIKNKRIIYSFLLTLILIISLNSFSNITIKANELYDGELLEVNINQKREFRGVWVSALISDIPRFSSITQYQNAITNVLNNMEKFHFNTMVFHIRIYNDAFYESKYNKYSSLYNLNASWDPLPWIIDECHKRGIEFHAWMNPYRVSTSTSSSLDSIAAKFHSSNAASNPSNLLTGYTYVILNPGLPTVQQFLKNVVMEVVEKYDVDAIHFDDYFYAAGVDDSLTYKMYGKDYPTLADFRRASINKLIESLYNSINDYNIENNKAVKLGISPTAIYRCGDGKVTYDEDGHAITNGAAMSSYFDQHYESACADTLLWIQKGWIDYIVPQLYVDGDQFTIMSSWWDKVTKNEKCLFVAGITQLSCDWDHFKTLQNRDGICLFSYKSLSKLMENEKANDYLKDSALPKINYKNQFTDASFEAVLFKYQDYYKLALSKTNDNINWYQVTNNLNQSLSYKNLTNVTPSLIEINYNNQNENQEEELNLNYTITPFLANGEIGQSLNVYYNKDLVEINFYDDEGLLLKSQYLLKGDIIIYPDLKQSMDFNYQWDKIIETATDNLDIKMIKSEKTYLISYVDPDGNLITTQEYRLGDSLTLPDLPISKKYTYSKWKVSSRYTVKGDDTITLYYDLIDYNLKVYGNGKKLIEKTVHYGDDISEILSSITNYNLLTGQEFIGFDNESNIITGDLIVNALYKMNTVTVTYKDNDIILKTETYNVGDNVILDNSDIEKNGYNFNYFTLNGEKITKINDIREDLIIQCHYSIIKSSENGCNNGAFVFELANLLLLLFIFKKRKN